MINDKYTKIPMLICSFINEKHERAYNRDGEENYEEGTRVVALFPGDDVIVVIPEKQFEVLHPLMYDVLETENDRKWAQIFPLAGTGYVPEHFHVDFE